MEDVAKRFVVGKQQVGGGTYNFVPAQEIIARVPCKVADFTEISDVDVHRRAIIAHFFAVDGTHAERIFADEGREKSPFDVFGGADELIMNVGLEFLFDAVVFCAIDGVPFEFEAVGVVDEARGRLQFASGRCPDLRFRHETELQKSVVVRAPYSDDPVEDVAEQAFSFAAHDVNFFGRFEFLAALGKDDVAGCACVGERALDVGDDCIGQFPRGTDGDELVLSGEDVAGCFVEAQIASAVENFLNVKDIAEHAAVAIAERGVVDDGFDHHAGGGDVFI